MVPRPQLPEIGELIDRGKYRIDRCIGEGGMGVVFAATHVALDKPRAIKWLLPELAHDVQAVQRFLGEARIASKIDHPNVVSPIDVRADPDAPYIVMELLRGETLEEHIAGRAFALADALRLFMPILQGVAAAHDRSIVHRDLKPANVFLTSVGGVAPIPKVLDFGIAKILDGSRSQAALTQQGALLGTIQYMSPEQLEDPSHVGPPTDVYALGVMLYRMLAGHLPYQGNLLDIALRIREGNARPLGNVVADLPASVDALVQRALAPSLARRYTDARSFAAALASVPEYAASAVAAPPRRRVRWNQRRSFPRVQDLPELAGLREVDRLGEQAEAASTLRPVETERAAQGRARWPLGRIAAGFVAAVGLSSAAWLLSSDEAPQRSAAVLPPAAPLKVAPDGGAAKTDGATESGWRDLGRAGAE